MSCTRDTYHTTAPYLQCMWNMQAEQNPRSAESYQYPKSILSYHSGIHTTSPVSHRPLIFNITYDMYLGVCGTCSGMESSTNNVDFYLPVLPVPHKHGVTSLVNDLPYVGKRVLRLMGAFAVLQSVAVDVRGPLVYRSWGDAKKRRQCTGVLWTLRASPT